MKTILVGIAAVGVLATITVIEHLQALHGWLFQRASIHNIELLFDYLKVIVPFLCLTSILAGVINRMQQRNSVQRSFTRFLFMKSFFWAVLEFGLFERLTNLWLILDAVSFTGALLTSIDFDVHILIRYVFPRDGKEEVLP